MKSTNRKEHVSALTKLQKFLTFIGSILGIVTACITIYTFSITSNAATTSPSSSVTTVSSINQIGENKSVTIPITEITSPNEKYSSSTTENKGSSDVTETSSSQEIQTSTTETTSSTENSTEAFTSSSEE
ncbi:TPA: DUF6556 family protein [Streptococcus suis]|uniref:DUF6556 family protein n=1 Tax=Streptococcus suis TaxID=1307 RepID=UPI00040E3D13|nr:DUF6556 family protein [Streptococcus suis]MCL4935045.1 hypothetical protein [Streptococcus suis]MDG4521066.1 hypothetical protein [Streptococcus suis]